MGKYGFTSDKTNKNWVARARMLIYSSDNYAITMTWVH